jgi:Carbamoyltransferase C-terminus
MDLEHWAIARSCIAPATLRLMIAQQEFEANRVHALYSVDARRGCGSLLQRSWGRSRGGSLHDDHIQLYRPHAQAMPRRGTCGQHRQAKLVSPDDNPRYYRIIKSFRGPTGILSIINTSFNIHEEPIVCSPEGALRAFKVGHLDYLALGSFIC